MGNKTSRRRAKVPSMVDGTIAVVPAGPAVQTSSTDPADDSKGVSCPDLSAATGAVPYREDAASSTMSPSGPRHVSYTVYRSYSNVAEAARRPEPRPDIRVYRRNTTARYAAGQRVDPAERSQTLPRGFGRSRSAMSGLQSTGAPPGSSEGSTSTLPRGRYMPGSELKRQTALGLSASGGLGHTVETKPVSKRASSTTSITSIGYRATADDLPDTGTIKRRLAQFETVFARALTKLYTSLADSVQLSSLSVAVCPDRANQHVSLWHYLNSPEVPVDLLAEDSGNGRAAYVLTIQPALFGGLMHVRRDCADDAAAPTSLAGDLVACLAAEAGAELARIFEYQIALLSDGLAIELLAGHAAHCVVNYMTSSGRHLDRNTIVLGAVRGEHVLETTKITPRLSVIVGQKELKWELDEILKRPGLRKELFLFSDDVEVDEGNPPWRFFASYYHDPMLYGYRGLIVEWDYTAAAECPGSSGVTYRLNGEDEASFPDEVDCRPDDFHRHYCPYRRLVGVDVVKRFNIISTPSETNVALRSSSSLSEFVRRLQGSSYARDQIQPVYRPVSVPTMTDNVMSEYDNQRTGSHDDWFAMVDDRDQHSMVSQAQQSRVMSDYPMTTNVSVVVTPSSPRTLPVVPEVSAEDWLNGDDTEVDQELVPQCPVINGYHVTGNGKIDYYVGQPEVVGDVIMSEPIESTTTTVVVQSKVVRHVNGGAVNAPVENDVGDVPVNGSVHRVVCVTELPDSTVKTSSSGYIIDEANRRTIRSDL